MSWSGAVLRLLALTCVCHVLSSALGFLCPCYVGVYISIVINGCVVFFDCQVVILICCIFSFSFFFRRERNVVQYCNFHVLVVLSGRVSLELS